MLSEHSDEWPPRGGREARPVRPRKPTRLRRLRLWLGERRRPRFSSASIAVICGCALGVALIAAPSLREVVAGGYERLKSAVTSRPDFILKRVAVVGAARVSDAELIAALGVADGAPALTFDAHAARARVERLGWVAAAEVRAVPPQLVEVRVTERRPSALWRREGRLALIDATGVVIADDLDLRAGRLGGADIETLLSLPLLVGPGAKKAAREAAMLDVAALKAGLRVLGWTRVGGRRWDLELLDGARVMLPEDDPGAALGLFAHWSKTADLREQGFAVYDFRDPTEPKARYAATAGL